MERLVIRDGIAVELVEVGYVGIVEELLDGESAADEVDESRL